MKELLSIIPEWLKIFTKKINTESLEIRG